MWWVGVTAKITLRDIVVTGEGGCKGNIQG